MPFAPAVATANEHYQAGRLESAQTLLRRHLQRSPDDGAACHLLGRVLAKLGPIEQAVHFHQRAVTLDPDRAVYRVFLARALADSRRPDEAVAQIVEAQRREPGDARTCADAGEVLARVGRLGEAAGAFRRALSIDPTSETARCELANLLIVMGDPEGALEHAQARARAHPDDWMAQRDLATTMNYAAGCTPAEVFEQHRRTADLICRVSPLSLPPLANDPDPDRRVRVGYLSPDLVDHSVTHFLEPILDHHDRASFEPVAYSLSFASDAVTRRLRPKFAQWRDVHDGRTEVIARMLHDDRIDVAIDLAGFTNSSGLWALRARAAPVQATYLGYPHSTGLPSLDARLVDSTTDPPGAEALAAEALVRLDPCFLCYRPPTTAPEPAPPPCAAPAPAPVTFGSFNYLGKVSAATRRTWARILRDTPGSRLVLKDSYFARDEARERMWGMLADLGVDRSRVDLYPKTVRQQDHLALYALVDIALDPFPYNGTTTTCEALLMGVPVVTLAGAAHAGRVGASLLTAAGLPDLIARGETDYARIASMLAADRDRLARLRTALRPGLLGSVLCDGARFTHRFETSLRGLWRRWCTRDRAGASRR